MRRFKYSVLFVMVLALVIACAKPPEAEKSDAKAAMDAAVSASADKYATADFNAGKKLWDDTEAQMTAKKYKEAKQGYVDAKAAFEKATAGVEAGKKTMTDEANAAVAGLEEAWKNLADAAKKVEKKLKDKKEGWDADAKAFSDGLKAAKDMIAADPVGAKAKAGELKALTEKWEAAFKELAAAPATPEKEAKPAKKGKK
jgi:soluble cytochrome b562